MQAIHYLTMSIIIPPLLGIYANRELLDYEGGTMNVGQKYFFLSGFQLSSLNYVGMVMDWREMAGRPTVRGTLGEDRWSSYSWAWSGGKRIGYGIHGAAWEGQTDPWRGWIVAFGWLCASGAE
jgi:protein SYS1